LEDKGENRNLETINKYLEATQAEVNPGSAYTVFLKDGKGGMSEIAHISTTAACYQVFRSLYEVLWLVQDAQKKVKNSKEERIKK